jgi:hypothetical protein
MKARIDPGKVSCGTCGTGLKGEQAWFESPSLIVYCQNPQCEEYDKKYHLPITRVELEPFVGPSEQV